MAFPTTLPNDASMLKAQDFVADTLRTSCTSGDTTININDGTKFPDPAGATYYATIDAATSATREIIGYTGRTTGGASTLTGVTRHLFSTNTVAHSSGVTIEQTIVAAFHEALKSELINVATKVGVDASAVNSTHDYKLSEVLTAGPDKAVGKTATQTLTNKTMTSPILNTAQWGTSATMTTATFSVIPGATSFAFRDTTNGRNNLLLADAGDATLFRNFIFAAAAAKIIPGATSLTFRDTADGADNLAITNAGAITVRSTISGVTTMTATTVTATNLGGTLSTAAQPNITSVGTLTSLGVGNISTSGTLTFTAANGKLIPGATDFTLTATDGSTSNMNVTNAGAVTFRSTVGGITTLTATTLTGTLSTAAQTNVTSLGTLTALSIGGNLTFTGASRRIIAGTTDLSIWDTGNANANLTMTDAGAITVRSTIGGVTTLTATTLAGTLSTAAQPNVTSLGTLTSLSISGALTVGGTITVNNSGFAVFNRQYYAAKKAVTFSATPTVDWNDSNVQSITLTGNITTLTLSNPNSGARYIMVLTQDSTGGRTVAWPAAVKWSGGTAPTLSLANKIDVIGLIYDGTNYYGTSSTNY